LRRHAAEASRARPSALNGDPRPFGLAAMLSEALRPFPRYAGAHAIAGGCLPVGCAVITAAMTLDRSACGCGRPVLARPCVRSSGEAVTALPLGMGSSNMMSLSAQAPLQGHAHVARHATGKVDDLDTQLVAALTKVLRPQLMDLLGKAGQRDLPARLLLVDGTPVIRAQLAWKTADLHLGQAVAGPLVR